MPPPTTAPATPVNKSIGTFFSARRIKPAPPFDRRTERVTRVSATMPPVAPPAQIVGARDGSIYINQGENFGVQVGQRFEVTRVVDEIRDANGAVLDRIMDRVGVLEVTQVLSQSAICSVVEGEAEEGDTITGL